MSMMLSGSTGEKHSLLKMKVELNSYLESFQMSFNVTSTADLLCEEGVKEARI